MICRVELDPSNVTPGSTLRPIARFESGPASIVLGRAEIFERETPELAVARLSTEGDHEAALAVLTAAAEAAEGPVYLPINAATGGDHTERRELASASGFALLQEKEEFIWTDTGQAVPAPELRLVPLAHIGREPFVPVIGRCVAQTLDRTDALMVGRRGPEQWTNTFLDHSASGADAQSWLLAETQDGSPIGFVGLAEPDPGTGTVVLIGVLPEQRGHRHVDQLLQAAYLCARTRGLTVVRSLVDVANHPMMGAMRRSGASPDARPWHKWLYVRASPA